MVFASNQDRKILIRYADIVGGPAGLAVVQPLIEHLDSLETRIVEHLDSVLGVLEQCREQGQLQIELLREILKQQQEMRKEQRKQRKGQRKILRELRQLREQHQDASDQQQQ